MENTPLHLGVLWYNSYISYLSPLRLPLPTSNKCNGNCCIILLFGGSMEKSSLVQSLLFSITLPCPQALDVRPVWRSGSCSRKKKKCSGEIVCTRLTVCYRANTGCQSQLQHSFSFLTQTLTCHTGRDTLRKVYARACVYVRMCYN